MRIQHAGRHRAPAAACRPGLHRPRGPARDDGCPAGDAPAAAHADYGGLAADAPHGADTRHRGYTEHLGAKVVQRLRDEFSAVGIRQTGDHHFSGLFYGPEARENEVANPKLHSKPFMPKDIQLFIRACKTLDSKKRVLSVYKRIYYLSDYMDSDVHIANILMDICHKYNLINLTNFAIELDPDYFLTRLYDEEYNYNKQIIRICINAIKFTKKDKLLECGLTIPKRFRK